MRRGLSVLAFLVSIFTFSFAAVTWGATAPARAAVFPGTTEGTRVYTVAPLDFNAIPTMQLVFQGACAKAGNQCQKIPTQASLDVSHVRGVDGEVGPISLGSASLDTQLRTDGNDTKSVIFGYSQGAQVAGFWLRNRAKEPAASLYASPSTTSFLLIGDPENTYGVPWTPHVPTDTAYKVTELWVQYDGWADWPTRPDPLAIANAIAGQMYVHPTAYLTVDPTSPDNVTWTNGNMTYILVPNQNLPIVQPLRWLGLNTLADSIQAQLRPTIEAAYDRPSTQQQADAYQKTGSRYGTSAMKTNSLLRSVSTDASDTTTPDVTGGATGEQSAVPDAAAEPVNPVPTYTAPAYTPPSAGSGYSSPMSEPNGSGSTTNYGAATSNTNSGSTTDYGAATSNTNSGSTTDYGAAASNTNSGSTATYSGTSSSSGSSGSDSGSSGSSSGSSSSSSGSSSSSSGSSSSSSGSSSSK